MSNLNKKISQVEYNEDYSGDTFLAKKLAELSVYFDKNQPNKIEISSNPETRSHQLKIIESKLKASVEELIFHLDDRPDIKEKNIKKFIADYCLATKSSHEIKSKYNDVITDYTGYFSRRKLIYDRLNNRELKLKIIESMKNFVKKDNQSEAYSQVMSADTTLDKFGLVMRVENIKPFGEMLGLCHTLQLSETMQIPVVVVQKTYPEPGLYVQVLNHERRHQINYFYQRKDRLQKMDSWLNEDDIQNQIILYERLSLNASEIQRKEYQAQLQYLKSIRNKNLLLKDKIGMCQNLTQYKELITEFFYKKIKIINNLNYKDELTSMIQGYTNTLSNDEKLNTFLSRFFVATSGADSTSAYAYWNKFLAKTTFFNNKFDPNSQIIFDIKQQLFNKLNSENFDPTISKSKRQNIAKLIIEILKNFPAEKTYK